jgi:hypothetical protein
MQRGMCVWGKKKLKIPKYIFIPSNKNHNPHPSQPTYFDNAGCIL